MTPNEFSDLLKRTIHETNERLEQNPDYGVFQHAATELTRIDQLTEDGSKIPQTTTDIGIMAAKELDASDPEYADLLYQVAYAVNPRD